MASPSPTQRSLKMLRDNGWQAGVVEYFNYYTQRRHDLFGWVDILAVRKDETLAVQTTSSSNSSERVKKILASDTLEAVMAAGWQVHVHGWRKNSKQRWTCRVVDVREYIDSEITLEN